MPAALEVCGDWDRADKHFQRASSIRQRVLGPVRLPASSHQRSRDAPSDGARRCVQDHPLTVESVEQREACYARFQETRVAGASELSETDRLREQLRLARAASAKDGGASGE